MPWEGSAGGAFKFLSIHSHQRTFLEPFVRMNGETDFDKCGAVGLLQEIVADECQNHQQDECDENSVDDSVCLSCLTCFARLFLCLVFQFVHGMLYFEVMLLYIKECVG